MIRKKVVTVTAWKRPDYTKHVIDNLRKCIGFEEYLLLPMIEPGHHEVLGAFNGLFNCEIVVNNSILGCSKNTLKALRRGFDIFDFVIHLKDDTVPGVDSLRYFEWIHNTYKDNKQIFTATAYNRIKEIEPQNFFTVYRKHWFTGWMWYTWIYRFEEMVNGWNCVTRDCNLNSIIRRDRYQILPVLSRSQNIGQHLGANNSSDTWARTQYNPIWVDNMTNISFENLTYIETTDIPSGDDIENCAIYPHSQTIMTVPHTQPKIGNKITRTCSDCQMTMSVPHTKPKIGNKTT